MLRRWLESARLQRGQFRVQPRNLLMDLDDAGRGFRFLIRDRDTQLTAASDAVLTAIDTPIISTPVRAPASQHDRRTLPHGATRARTEGRPAVRNNQDVAIPINTSNALLRPSQLEDLVRAVRDSEEHDEHDWLEWKSNLDLASKGAKQHIAKQVLGFANRTVAAAARHAQGYAYVLVGVEPGSVVGVSTIDNADLTSGIAPYVGAVQWAPEYVIVDDKTVLVVIIDPPEPGHPIFTLRRGIGNHQPGAVFVRVPGKTEQASPAQIEALVERAHAARESIDLTVRASPATIEAGPIVDPDRLAAILADERELLMRPERSRRPAPSRSPKTPAGAIESLAISGLMGSWAAPRVQPDERSEEDYAQEVETYLAELKDVLIPRFFHRRLHHAGGELRLRLDNPTDRNFAGVQVAVHLSGNVRQWPEGVVDEITPLRELPHRPRKLGTPTRTRSPLEHLMRPPSFPILPAINYDNLYSPGYSIEDGGSVKITFDPVHLRPRTPLQLPAVELIVDEQVGTELLMEWEATAENANGFMTGTQTIIVAAPTVGIERPSDDR